MFGKTPASSPRRRPISRRCSASTRTRWSPGLVARGAGRRACVRGRSVGRVRDAGRAKRRDEWPDAWKALSRKKPTLLGVSDLVRAAGGIVFRAGRERTRGGARAPPPLRRLDLPEGQADRRRGRRDGRAPRGGGGDRPSLPDRAARRRRHVPRLPGSSESGPLLRDAARRRGLRPDRRGRCPPVGAGRRGRRGPVLRARSPPAPAGAVDGAGLRRVRGPARQGGQSRGMGGAGRGAAAHDAGPPPGAPARRAVPGPRGRPHPLEPVRAVRPDGPNRSPRPADSTSRRRASSPSAPTSTRRSPSSARSTTGRP